MDSSAAVSVLPPSFANDNETIAAFLLDARGQAAALAGLAFAANPYPAGSFEAACWSAGWVTGIREMVVAATAPPPGHLRLCAIASDLMAV